ncbi:MAG: FGGY-family carbohydrate kinase [Firmicutes bacterium]|nr:FGGY-family carbohydrate kinase [Bacillota bacterium]
MTAKEKVLQGETTLGLEFGSTRIKAVLTDKEGQILAEGGHSWENRYENGIWTYSMEDIETGFRACYAELAADVANRFGVPLTTIGAIGISAMMHGYMAFGADGTLLVPFRTWRNNNTGAASEKLTELFGYPIPQRWSIAHLYQAILNGEPHVSEISYISTLAGFIHWKLTGRKAVGVGEAIGMFPVDLESGTYNKKMVGQFEELIRDKAYPWKLEEILPEILYAGQEAGRLTEEGARFIDPTGTLQPGIPFCPPEGDAGTGMVATNSVAAYTGNVSAGTSVFAMIVLDKPLSKPYPEIDLVATPSGRLVAMVHSNNCTTALNAWIGLFDEYAKLLGVEQTTDELYGRLYRKSLEAAPDAGGLLAYGYYSGEHITGFETGCPLFVHPESADFTLANFMRTHLYTSIGALTIGMEILKKENVRIDRILGHGGLFKTKGVGQQMLADALAAPVSVMPTAGEGGPWGMAVLAAYMKYHAEGETLEEYLNRAVFSGVESETLDPQPEGAAGLKTFLERYRAGLGIERAAVESSLAGHE